MDEGDGTSLPPAFRAKGRRDDDVWYSGGTGIASD